MYDPGKGFFFYVQVPMEGFKSAPRTPAPKDVLHRRMCATFTFPRASRSCQRFPDGFGKNDLITGIATSRAKFSTGVPRPSNNDCPYTGTSLIRSCPPPRTRQ